jgi:hypothetical protein
VGVGIRSVPCSTTTATTTAAACSCCSLMRLTRCVMRVVEQRSPRDLQHVTNQDVMFTTLLYIRVMPSAIVCARQAGSQRQAAKAPCSSRQRCSHPCSLML